MARLARKPAGHDDLGVIFPDRTVTLAGMAITVREFTFAEWLDCAAALASPISERLEPSATIECVIEVMAEQQHESIALASISTGLDAELIASLPDEAQLTLFGLLASINLHLIVPREEQKATGRGVRWGDILFGLQMRGIDFHNMTERQILLAYESSERVSRRTRAERVIDTGYAVNGGKKTESYVKELTSG